jgi:hypothetical protein
MAIPETDALANLIEALEESIAAGEGNLSSMMNAAARYGHFIESQRGLLHTYKQTLALRRGAAARLN